MVFISVLLFVVYIYGLRQVFVWSLYIGFYVGDCGLYICNTFQGLLICLWASYMSFVFMVYISGLLLWVCGLYMCHIFFFVFVVFIYGLLFSSVVFICGRLYFMVYIQGLLFSEDVWIWWVSDDVLFFWLVSAVFLFLFPFFFSVIILYRDKLRLLDSDFLREFLSLCSYFEWIRYMFGVFFGVFSYSFSFFFGFNYRVWSEFTCLWVQGRFKRVFFLFIFFLFSCFWLFLAVFFDFSCFRWRLFVSQFYG